MRTVVSVPLIKLEGKFILILSDIRFTDFVRRSTPVKCLQGLRFVAQMGQKSEISVFLRQPESDR